ncbi:MAG: tetratricopeptide (TPR) repeat protein [Myxococcota bacterium]|jgi:tetratricopeptide (TPR) repeat protein
MTVLVVSTDPAMKSRVCDWLSRQRIAVEASDSGANAVNVVAKGHVALALYHLVPTAFADMGSFARVRETTAGKALRIVALVDAADVAIAPNYGSALGISNYVIHSELKRLAVFLSPLQAAIEPAPAAASKPESSGFPSFDGLVTLAELQQVHLAMASLTYSEQLGVPSDAPALGIKRAYLARIDRYNLDCAPPETGEEGRRRARDIYTQFGQAYQVLRDPGRRAAYLARLSGVEPESKPAPEPAPKPTEKPAAKPVLSVQDSAPTRRSGRLRADAPETAASRPAPVLGGGLGEVPGPPSAPKAGSTDEVASGDSVVTPAVKGYSSFIDSLSRPVPARRSTTPTPVAPTSGALLDSLSEFGAERETRRAPRSTPDVPAGGSSAGGSSTAGVSSDRLAGAALAALEAAEAIAMEPSSPPAETVSAASMEGLDPAAAARDALDAIAAADWDREAREELAKLVAATAVKEAESAEADREREAIQQEAQRKVEVELEVQRRLAEAEEQRLAEAEQQRLAEAQARRSAEVPVAPEQDEPIVSPFEEEPSVAGLPELQEEESVFGFTSTQSGEAVPSFEDDVFIFDLPDSGEDEISYGRESTVGERTGPYALDEGSGFGSRADSTGSEALNPALLAAAALKAQKRRSETTAAEVSRAPETAVAATIDEHVVTRDRLAAAVALRPSVEDVASAAYMLRLMGDYNRAIPMFEKCLSLRPSARFKYELEFARALAHERDGESEQASAAFERARASAPPGRTEVADYLADSSSDKKSGRFRLFSKED